MKAWIKLHTEIIDDPKIGRLSFADKGLWLCLLALAGKIDDRDADGALTGKIGSLDDVTWLLRTQVADIQPGIERMVSAAMLHWDGDALCVTHFAERQEQPSEKPSAIATRVKRHRAAAKQNSNADVTGCNGDVTAPKRHRTEQNREEEIQNRTESESEQTTTTPRARHPRESGEQMRAAVAAAAATRSMDTPEIAETNAEVDRATKALTELGIEPTMVRKIVTNAPYAHIIGWANYARNQPGLQNPAGYVIKMLRAGEAPPRSLSETPRKTWFTPEEETMFFGTDKRPVIPAVIPAQAGNTGTQCTT